jgi:hypothetical protein
MRTLVIRAAATAAIGFAPFTALTSPLAQAACPPVGTDASGNMTTAGHNHCCADMAAMGRPAPECAGGAAPVQALPPQGATTTNRCSPLLGATAVT